MMSFLFGSFMGLGIGMLIGWHAGKIGSKTTVENVTVKLNAQDLIDIIDAEDAVEMLKKDTHI